MPAHRKRGVVGVLRQMTGGWDRSTWIAVAISALALAAAAVLLQWLEFQLLTRTHALEIYAVLIAVGFMAFGIWVGARLFRTSSHKPTPGEEGNPKARVSLGISEREMEVLGQLANGLSNKEIAYRLNVSPNTVKTHVARLYEKLGAKRRTEAVLRARELGMLP